MERSDDEGSEREDVRGRREEGVREEGGKETAVVGPGVAKRPRSDALDEGTKRALAAHLSLATLLLSSLLSVCSSEISSPSVQAFTFWMPAIFAVELHCTPSDLSKLDVGNAPSPVPLRRWW